MAATAVKINMLPTHKSICPRYTYICTYTQTNHCATSHACQHAYNLTTSKIYPIVMAATTRIITNDQCHCGPMSFVHIWEGEAQLILKIIVEVQGADLRRFDKIK